MCVIISVKCVGSLSSANLGKAPGFPAPPGHLAPVTGSQLELCLCVSAEEPASSKHYCLIRFESRSPRTQTVYMWLLPHTLGGFPLFLEEQNKKENLKKKKTKGVETTRNKCD